MQKKLANFFFIGRRFKREFKRQIRTLILITLGFTIAFTWRQTIFDLSQSFVKFITNVKSPNTSNILTSIFITIVSVILIYLTAYMFKDEGY